MAANGFVEVLVGVGVLGGLVVDGVVVAGSDEDDVVEVGLEGATVDVVVDAGVLTDDVVLEEATVGVVVDADVLTEDVVLEEASVGVVVDAGVLTDEDVLEGGIAA